MKTLVICRHAKSDWSQALPDFDRPLNERGIKDAAALGKRLSGGEFRPDLIISSPAIRAKTTAESVAAAIGYELHAIRLEQSLYDEGPGNEMGIIQAMPELVESIMLFGHNPTQETLVRMLLNSESSVVMPTGAMAAFEVFGEWRTIQAKKLTLKWFLIPRMVR